MGVLTPSGRAAERGRELAPVLQKSPSTEGRDQRRGLARRSQPPTSGGLIDREWIAGAANGKVRVLLGSAAVRERRRVGREMDQTITRALQGKLAEAISPCWKG